MFHVNTILSLQWIYQAPIQCGGKDSSRHDWGGKWFLFIIQSNKLFRFKLECQILACSFSQVVISFVMIKTELANCQNFKCQKFWKYITYMNTWYFQPICSVFSMHPYCLVSLDKMPLYQHVLKAGVSKMCCFFQWYMPLTKPKSWQRSTCRQTNPPLMRAQYLDHSPTIDWRAHPMPHRYDLIAWLWL